jgi:hypothetical protein
MRIIIKLANVTAYLHYYVVYKATPVYKAKSALPLMRPYASSLDSWHRFIVLTMLSL